MAEAPPVLFVAATGKEISGLTGGIVHAPGLYGSESIPDIRFLVTGVGIAATAARLSAVLSTHSFRRVVNIGLCGSFLPEFPPGCVVQVVREEFADLGAQDHEDFIDAFQLGLTGRDEFPFHKGFLVGPSGSDLPLPLPKVSGCTVNCVHGHGPSIEKFRQRSDAMVESMEGAAVFYSCCLASVPCVQIRAVSNFVEPRNRAAWRVEVALSALWQELNARMEIITG